MLSQTLGTNHRLCPARWEETRLGGLSLRDLSTAGSTAFDGHVVCPPAPVRMSQDLSGRVGRQQGAVCVSALSLYSTNIIQ